MYVQCQGAAGLHYKRSNGHFVLEQKGPGHFVLIQKVHFVLVQMVPFRYKKAPAPELLTHRALEVRRSSTISTRNERIENSRGIPMESLGTELLS